MSESADTPHVFLLASDLMLTSTVSGFANATDAKFQSGNAAAAISVATSGARMLLLIDLNGLNTAIGDLTEKLPDSVVETAVAYGPHVHTETLQAARDAGIPRVISRGQFSTNVSQIIREFVND